jgi:hypothetical protein
MAEDRAPCRPRQLIVTIDGDGFIYRTAFDGRRVGEVFYEQVLTRYPFRFCASFIAGETEAYRDEFDIDLARRILALPNVDAASHSWSHPSDWALPVDLDQEIEGSVRHMEVHFLAPGKRVTTFLWTGRCNPAPAAIRAAERAGLCHLNGGDAALSHSIRDGAVHYHARAPQDWALMGVGEKMRAAKAVRVYPFLRDCPLDLGGFANVISLFEAHPQRPVHVAIHWYSAVRRDSLDALGKVLDWCAASDLVSVSVPQYIETVRHDAG